MPGTSALVSIIIMPVCALALIALEAFIPGVSIAGIGGIVLFGLSTYLCWNAYGAAAAIALLVLCAALSFLTMRSIYQSMKKGRLAKSGIFLDTQSAPTVRPAASSALPAPGDTGIARTALRPAGIAEFGEQRIHVSSDGRFINQGAAVQVLRTEGALVIVIPAENQ